MSIAFKFWLLISNGWLDNSSLRNCKIHYEHGKLLRKFCGLGLSQKILTERWKNFNNSNFCDQRYWSLLYHFKQKENKKRSTLGSFVSFGLEIQNWESTSTLISKLVIKYCWCTFMTKFVITSWLSFSGTSLSLCDWLIFLKKWEPTSEKGVKWLLTREKLKKLVINKWNWEKVDFTVFQF